MKAPMSIFKRLSARLRKAVSQRDIATLKSMMTEDFGYKLDPAMSGPGVFQYWDQENLWPELDGHFSRAVRQKRRVPGGSAAVCRSIS